MEDMSIGEFARRSRLSPKALRLYDDLGLLPPDRVDSCNGYRFYAESQLEQARLISALRQLQVPLAEIGVILGLGRAEAAERLDRYWATAEAAHSARRRLAGYLVDSLKGRSSIMYEVGTRDIPARALLCLKCNVDGQAGAWALGKEFVGLLRGSSLPRLEGRAGAAFCIYWGEVNDDSDGPVEWCRPVPDDAADALATKVPQLTLRHEPAHHEAFVDLGPYDENPTEWRLVSDALHTWAQDHEARPSDLGVRVTYLARPPITETSRPDCDFAVPFS